MIRKISLIGSGAVGSSLAFLLLKELSLEELVLIDINLGLAKGVALDLEDCRFLFNTSTQIKASSDYKDISSSDIIVFTAGRPRRQGMERKDLIKINASVASQAAKKIKRYSPKALIIAVTNPLDFIVYVFSKTKGLNPRKVLGMGATLDGARFSNSIAKKLAISPRSVDAKTMGLHSKDMVVLPAYSKIGNLGLEYFLKAREVKELARKTKMRGAEIVGWLKNSSARFAPAASCFSLIESLASGEKSLQFVSVLLNGEYGLKDVCMGCPAVVSLKEGVGKIIELKLSAREKKEILAIKDYFRQCMSLL